MTEVKTIVDDLLTKAMADYNAELMKEALEEAVE